MNLIDHVSVTVQDLERARSIYDAILVPLGAERVVSNEKKIGYGQRCRPGDSQHSYFTVYLSVRVTPPSRKRHVAFKAPSRAAVDAFFEGGVRHGAKVDLSPQVHPEYHPGYYSAFLVDPWGNRLEAVFHELE